MFRSRRKNRRRDRSKSTRLCRLGVELMEGRMMLSATGVDVQQPALDVYQPLSWPAEISLTSEYVKFFNRDTQGGIVNFNINVSDSSVQLGSTRSTISSADSVGTWHFLNYGDIAATTPNTATYAVQPGLAFDGPDLDVAVLLPATDNDSATTNMQPVVIGPPTSPSPGVPAPSDGGAIPIHAIFADLRRDSNLTPGVKLVSAPAAETSLAELASARQESNPDGSIAGEWARAMVFEIAGGEPTTVGQHSESENGGSLNGVKPLSSVETQEQQNGKFSKEHAAAQSNNAAPAAQPVGEQSAPQNGDVAAIISQLLKGDVAAAASITAAQLVPEHRLVAETPDLATLAAFDQMGDDRAAIIESTVDSKTWLRSIGTSPLLMVLALERIAALNSRRGARESRVAATKRPVRSRS